MIVYRIEWPEGTGFYNGRDYDTACNLSGGLPDKYIHPEPMNDSKFADQYYDKGWAIDPDHRELRWAFESLRSLRRWFYKDEWIERMSAAGCLLCIYDAYDGSTVVGRTQCAFDHRVAKLVHKEPLINVLEKV